MSEPVVVTNTHRLGNDEAMRRIKGGLPAPRPSLRG